MNSAKEIESLDDFSQFYLLDLCIEICFQFSKIKVFYIFQILNCSSLDSSRSCKIKIHLFCFFLCSDACFYPLLRHFCCHVTVKLNAFSLLIYVF